MAIRTILSVSNPDLHDNNRTSLTVDVASGGTTLNVAAMTGFPVAVTATTTSYYYVVIGNYGEESTEIVLVSNSTNTVLTTSALKYSHSASDPVTYIQYNQIKFYGRTISGGTSSLVSGGTLDIDCSQQFTTFEYLSPAYSIFVTTYYRSATTIEESEFSDEITTNSFGFNSAKKIIEAGLRKALTRADENPDASLGWSVLIDLLNEGLNEIVTKKKQWQCLHKISTPITATIGVPYIEKPIDLSVLEFITVDGNKIEFITKMNYNQRVNSTTTQGIPSAYTIKNDKIFLYPTPSSASSVVFEYYATPSEVTSLTSVVKKEFSTILVYFIAAQAAYIRNNEKRGNLMEVKFQQTLLSQIEDVTGYEQMGDGVSTEFTSIYGPFGGDFDGLI